MKKMMIFVGIFLFCWNVLVAQEKTIFTGIKFRDVKVEKVNREVDVRMQVDLREADVPRQYAITVRPVIVSKDKQQRQVLPAITVNGSIRYKVESRRLLLVPELREKAGQMVRFRPKDKTVVEYHGTVAYEPWMLDGSLEIEQVATGCASCDEGSSLGGLSPLILERYVPQYVVPFLNPVDETEKARGQVYSVELLFRQGSAVVNERIGDNKKALASIGETIKGKRDNKDLKVRQVRVVGYASPEADSAFNQRLSQRRAENLVAYLSKQNPGMDKSLWVAEGRGEDWKGLMEALKSFEPRKDVEKTIVLLADFDGKGFDRWEKKMMANGAEYRLVYDRLYKGLRRNDVEVEYVVREYTAEEAAAVMKEDPKMVSVAEMYKVAGMYPKNSPEYCEVMKTAARTYPDDPAVLNNAALALMESGRPAEAIALLEGKEDARLLNVLGVAYARDNRFDRAVEVLNRAVRAGNRDAARNLEEVRKVMDQL